MNKHWHVVRNAAFDDEVIGPLSDVELIELRSAGRLGRKDLIFSSLATSGKWVYAEAHEPLARHFDAADRRRRAALRSTASAVTIGAWKIAGLLIVIATLLSAMIGAGWFIYAHRIHLVLIVLYSITVLFMLALVVVCGRILLGALTGDRGGLKFIVPVDLDRDGDTDFFVTNK